MVLKHLRTNLSYLGRNIWDTIPTGTKNAPFVNSFKESVNNGNLQIFSADAKIYFHGVSFL